MEPHVTDLPIVCTLQPGELNARAAELLPGLIARATRRAAIDGGFRFEFAPTDDLLSAISVAIDAERRCCRFLRFRVTVEPDEGPVYVDVTGPPGAQEFLTALIENG